MKVDNRLFIAVLLLVTSLVTGCASVPLTSMEEDTKAKSFAAPATGKANIYVYRNESYGGAIMLTIALDGKLAGQTSMRTYFLWEVDPGSHEISSLSENTSTLKLNTEAGKTYFIWQEVKMGMWSARSQLQQVDEAAGRKGVSECKRAQSNF